MNNSILQRNENGKLNLNRLELGIFFDDLFDEAKDFEEIQWILNKIISTAYLEAIAMGHEKGIEREDYDWEI